MTADTRTHTHMHWLYISPIYPLCIPMLIEVARKKFQSQGACSAIEWAPDSSPAGSLAQLFLRPFALNRSTHCCLQAVAENLQKRHTLLRDVAERTLVFALLEYNPNRSCEPLSNLVTTYFQVCPNQDGRGHLQALRRWEDQGDQGRIWKENRGRFTFVLIPCILISSGAPNLQEALDGLENAQSTIRGWKSRLQLNSYRSLRWNWTVFETLSFNHIRAETALILKP